MACVGKLDVWGETPQPGRHRVLGHPVHGAIAVWRSPRPDGEWRTRCACVWTHGRIGTITHPLVIGAQWDVQGNNAVAAACVIGPSWDDATQPALHRLLRDLVGEALERDPRDGATARRGHDDEQARS